MKKIFALFVVLFTLQTSSFACPFCNRKIMDGIYNSQFYPNLLTMLSAFIALAVIVGILSAMAAKKCRSRLAAPMGFPLPTRIPLMTAATVLGIGIGGFIDGIVLHQILQVHEMLSNRIPATDYIGKSVNMFWDGIFHFFCMTVVVIGVILMWKLMGRKDLDRSGSLLGGGLLLGWGLFNIVEGVIDHQLLKLHNVVELSSNHDVANFGFLAVSAIMILAGAALVNRKR